MLKKSFWLMAALLFLGACSDSSTSIIENTPKELVESADGVDSINEEKVIEEVIEKDNPAFSLADYKGTWEETHDVDAPYISIRLENINGDTADVFVDAMSQGQMYIASAHQENVAFEQNKALIVYDNDGSDASGEVAIEILEEEIVLTIVITQEGGPYWRLPEGEFHLVKQQPLEETAAEEPIEEAEVTEETIVENTVPESLGEPIKGNPQNDQEYLLLAKEIMDELEIVLNSMYEVYDFGSMNPGDYSLVKPHLIHLTTAAFADNTLKPYIEEYYCECDSGVLPGMDERLADAYIEKPDEQTFIVEGNYTFQPEYPDSSIGVQVLEFKKEQQSWKLNNWHYE